MKILLNQRKAYHSSEDEGVTSDGSPENTPLSLAWIWKLVETYKNVLTKTEHNILDKCLEKMVGMEQMLDDSKASENLKNATKNIIYKTIKKYYKRND